MPRLLDVLIALIALVFISPVLIVSIVICALSTRSSGVFLQPRVGRYARLFTIIKLRTMYKNRVTKSGGILRKYKIDELPQLLNIVLGDMAIVGPRPDVAGYYDVLEGENRKILALRPGLTSPAAIKYRNEEQLLAAQNEPTHYNDTILFPDKVRMNLEYFYNRSFLLDCKIILQTIKSLIN